VEPDASGTSGHVALLSEEAVNGLGSAVLSVLSVFSVEQVVVFRRGRASSAVRSVEGLALSHEARPGSTNTAGSLNGERVPRTFLTTEVARACSWAGWSRESVDDARVRVVWTGGLEDLGLALESRVGKRFIV
jgi:hypothetical protein